MLTRDQTLTRLKDAASYLECRAAHEDVQRAIADAMAFIRALPSSSSPEGMPDTNLETLIRDLRPYAEKPAGSLRIDMEDVRSILALYDAMLAASPATPVPNGGEWQDIAENNK